MSEEKVTNKKEIELLEKRVEELEAELKKVGGIANSITTSLKKFN
jgi:hypothetical protein